MSARPIRVLHLRDSPWVDGPGRTIVETASHIDPSRVEYHVGVFASDGGEHALVDALASRSASVHRLPDRPGIDSGAIDAVLALLDRLQIDVLHTSEFRSNVFGLLCRRRRKLRLVSTVHGWIANNLRGRLYRFVDKLLLRGFDGVIMVSAATRALVPRWWLGDRRVLVLPNALVLGSYGRDAVERPRRRFDPADIVLLNVGRLSSEKAQDLLLRALARLAPRYPGLKLKFAGIGPLEDSLRALAAELGIAGRVSFLGYVKDMPGLYGECDLLVQSSLTEGMPNVILEAAYLRMPMVATAVGGTAEVVKHGHSAWLIRPGSVDELADGIQAFLEKPADFASMAARGHEDVRQQFSFDRRTQRLMEFYESLCAGLAA